jgi:hypothetical protein
MFGSSEGANFIHWTTQSQSQSQSHVMTDGQSVRCLDVEPLLVLMTRCLLLLTITVESFWGTFSDERSGLSIVSQSLHFSVICQYIYK